MENYFDTPIDFETMSNISITTLEKQSSRESDLFEEVSQDSQKKYLCTSFGCGKIFKYRSEIARHVIVHQESRPYCCTYGDCRKSFKRADALETHVQTHAKVLPYACDIPGCDKKFATKSAIRYHQIKHDNKRSFRCEFPGCDRSFLTSSQLRQHEKSFNVHYRFLEFKVKEEEPLKIMKGEPQYLYQQFSKFKSEQYNFTQGKIEIQDHNNENVDRNIPENMELISKYFAQRKVIQQEQLQERTKWTNLLENTLRYEFQISQHVEAMEPSKFFDSNELKFLEFLKNPENNSL